MSTDRKIRFGVLGCGHIGKRHAEMVLRNQEAELVALCDIADRGTLAIEAYSVPYFHSLDELLMADLDLDVVCVCTPNGLHAAQSIALLSKGVHVVCEKPMALSKADCEAVIFKALQMSRQVFCVMQNRYSPPSVWIKSIIDQKILGQIYTVQINCYWNRDGRYYTGKNWKGDQQLDGGTLFTQFSHFIDIMYWLFGDITDIRAQFADFSHKDTTDFEDSGLVSFRFINGGMGCINYSTSVWDRNLESSMTVVAEHGSIKIGGQYMNEVEVCHVKDYQMPELAPSGPANDYGAYKGSAANHHFIIENVVDTLKGRSSMTTNALEGLKVVDIIERIYSLRPDTLTKKQKVKTQH
jgi:UDP-N-acetyl-2-amino-2-deoxyglucuronate dehydrogenase